MNIVITGGSGFVGSYLCEKLIDDGHEIIVVDNLLTCLLYTSPSPRD